MNRSNWGDFLLEHAQVLSITVFFVACCALFATLSTFFLGPGNLLNLLRQSAPMLIVATAMTFVITTGGIDLSVGAVVALTNALAAIALAAAWPWPAAVVAVLAAGGLIGAVQGWFIAFQRLPAFLVTLAGLSSLRGLALLMTQGYSIPIAPHGWFLDLGRGWLLGVPVPSLFALAVAVAGFVALGRMRYGRHLVAVGANPEAARRFGIPAGRVILSVYVLSGLSAALAGLIIAARLGSGSSNAAVGFELQAIAAVVLGGTSLFGGSGTVLGTILGALTVAVIENGLILIHVSPFLTQIVTGAIILLAVWLNTRVFARLTASRKRS
ncbi:MAG: ABC transporter permease [Acetobacteraceae bacterium]|nr:ABC transporter permease [Acetobacteraceae bacterium]